jgi:hypothetical protein
MVRRITVLLPVDDDERRPRPLAAGVTSLAGRPMGVVDNGLWRSTAQLVEHVERETGGPMAARQPFDHLSPHFDEQQRALRPFATLVAAALTGLGN